LTLYQAYKDYWNIHKWTLGIWRRQTNTAVT
jgi:hypothetical protein